MRRLLIVFSLMIVTVQLAWSQVDGAMKRYIKVGSLQSHVTAYGSERAWTGTYYEGLQWPAEYPYQDNSVIKRHWIACQDFTDHRGDYYSYLSNYFVASDVGITLFPMELKQSTRFMPPEIYVDGNELTGIFLNQIDTVDANQIPDRIVTNVVNTYMGLTQERTFLAFSQQYHDNYFIKIFRFTNTGNVDDDPEIELTDSLKGVRIGWGTRYSLGREAGWEVDGAQSYGKYSWVTVRGEDYAQNYTEEITLDDPIKQWIRSGFQWLGQSDLSTWDNIGAPDRGGSGRLASPHHTGVAILHVDVSATDSSDDVNQPVFLGWHAGDQYPTPYLPDPDHVDDYAATYSMLSGNPYPSAGAGGTSRLDEENLESITHRLSPWQTHGYAEGTNLMSSYGPYDLAHGESIVIIEAEGISGINRQLCEEIGARWKAAFDDPTDNGPFTLPDGSSTTDEDEYKNSWVYTGKDSIMLTFSRALRNFDAAYMIPQPPQPPTNFTVESGGDRIYLSWLASPDEGSADFGGYRLFRAIGKPDTTYDEIFACGAGTDHTELVDFFDDTTPVRGQSYYYYIVAFNDGTNNVTQLNPQGSLHSSKFYTMTTEAAVLKRQAVDDLDKIRVVPNPYNIRAAELQYTGEPNKIAFLDIPGQCTIRIFTERGDLIMTIEHNDGSGDESWNLITDHRQTIVSGIYLAHFDLPDGRSAFRKFIVIR